jgi:hypothetical protein
MKSIAVLMIAMVGVAFAQEPTIVKRAAAAVPVLRSRMIDPDSFVLEAVRTATSKEIQCEGFGCRHKTPVLVTNVCFAFRSHNHTGGYPI